MRGRSNSERLFALFLGGAVAVAGLIRDARQARTPEGRKRAAEIRARDAAYWAQQKLEHKRRELARTEALAYFDEGGEGRGLLDAATLTTIPVGSPFPDARIGSARFGNVPSTVLSDQANAVLVLNLDTRDGMGTVRLSIGGVPRFEQTFGHHPYDDAEYLHLEGDDLQRLEVLARLLGSLKRGFAGVRVRHPDWRKVQEQLWTKHLARSPDLAEAIAWPGSGPYGYL